MRKIKVALVHYNPKLADIEYNHKMIKQAASKAADLGAKWVITPELCMPGYFFEDSIGTGWIKPQPDSRMQELLELTKERGINLFLSYPEREETDGKLYNALFVLGSNGEIPGKHRKINIHPGPEEGWSAPGKDANTVMVDGVNTGLLVCADIYEPEIALELKEKGAELLICPVAWGQKYGPGDRWEKRTAETGLPLWVCNRTGKERQVNWNGAESVIASGGKRLLVYQGLESSLLLFDWDMDDMKLLSDSFEVVDL